MDYKRAAVLWEVNERKARKICKALDIDPRSISTDTVPIYLPDRRYIVFHSNRRKATALLRFTGEEIENMISDCEVPSDEKQ